MTEDPIRDGELWYGYVGNNPLTFVDPTGLTTGAARVRGEDVSAEERKEIGEEEEESAVEVGEEETETAPATDPKEGDKKKFPAGTKPEATDDGYEWLPVAGGEYSDGTVYEYKKKQGGSVATPDEVPDETVTAPAPVVVQLGDPPVDNSGSTFAEIGPEIARVAYVGHADFSQNISKATEQKGAGQANESVTPNPIAKVLGVIGMLLGGNQPLGGDSDTITGALRNQEKKLAIKKLVLEIKIQVGGITTNLTPEKLEILLKKMSLEIEGILSKDRGPKAEQYALLADRDGSFPDVRNGIIQLQKDDVWKYGQTTNRSERYSENELRAMGLRYQPQFVGTKTEVLVMEKIKIYSYFVENGTLPPGNKIFR